MKWVAVFWNFLDQFSGVATTIGWVIVGIIGFYRWFPGHIGRLTWILFFGILFLTLIAIRFLWKQIFKTIEKFNNEQQSNQIKEDIHRLQESTTSNSTELILPSTRQLERWHNFSKKIAREWSGDARETNMSVYISKERGAIEIKPQVTFFSEWKSQELTVFLWAHVSKSMKDKTEFSLMVPNRPFFVRFRNWDWAVKKAYERISHLLGAKFELALYSHYDKFHFRFEYYQGGVQKEVSFDFEGKILETNDGNKISYSSRVLHKNN